MIKNIDGNFPPLSETHPEIAMQAHGWDAKTVSRGSDLVLMWRCSKGHVRKARVANHVKRGGKCLVCMNRTALPGFNDLATTHPDLALELVDGDSRTITSKSSKRFHWRCEVGHQWATKVSHRVNGSGCPFCAGQRSIPGETDLQTVAPQIAVEAVGWDTSMVTLHSDFVGEWQCSHGHRWSAAVKKRARGDGCPYCSGHRLLVGFNDINSQFPNLAMQLVDVDPKELKVGSSKKVSWKCDSNHSWLASPKSRAAGTGCPYCSHNKLLSGFNDLKTRNPALASEAKNWDPSKIISASGTKLEWQCQMGHVWMASINNRLKDSGCPYCYGRLPVVGTTDLLTTHPLLASEAVDWDPTLVKAGTNARRRWACQNGHQWTATIASRAINGSGCPDCASFGFSPAKEAWIYLFEHADFGLMQVGITNDPKMRIATHKRVGWDFREIYGPISGDVAQHLESQIVRLLERSGASMRNKKGLQQDFKRTEAWVKSSYPISNLKNLLKLARDAEATDQSTKKSS